MRQISLAVVSFATGLFCASPVFAVEKLNFDLPLSTQDRVRVEHYLKNNVSDKIQSFKVAQADLNGDQLFEYIVKTDLCVEELCSYILLADDDTSLLGLGVLKAKTIALGGSDPDGLRKIQVYQNKVNDFNFVTYRWQPERNQYEMTQTED